MRAGGTDRPTCHPPTAVIRGLWPTNTLLPGTALNSSDTIDKVNFLQVQVGPDRQVGGRLGVTGVQGPLCGCALADRSPHIMAQSTRLSVCSPNYCWHACIGNVMVHPFQLWPACASQLVGIGSNAAILQSNIVACGPSIIHIVDTVRCQHLI